MLQTSFQDPVQVYVPESQLNLESRKGIFYWTAAVDISHDALIHCKHPHFL